MHISEQFGHIVGEMLERKIGRLAGRLGSGLYRSSSKITRTEWCKTLIDKTLSYSIVRHTTIKNNKSAELDGIVGELIKYWGNTICEMLTLLNLVGNNEYVPTYWKKGLIVSLLKNGDREDPGNYRGITLLSVVGKLYSRVINNHLLNYLALNNKLHEW